MQAVYVLSYTIVTADRRQKLICLHSLFCITLRKRCGPQASTCAAGSTEVTDDVAEDLLRAADQYMLDGLKHLCEETISKQLNNDNLAEIYDLAENFNAPQLGRRCALYALEHFVVSYLCFIMDDMHADSA